MLLNLDLVSGYILKIFKFLYQRVEISARVLPVQIVVS